MSGKYKFHNPHGIYFVSFAVVDWADVFIRNVYKDILLDSFRHCQKEKGLVIYAWVIMSSHVHLIISRQGTIPLEDIMRDMKKFTAHKIIGAIMESLYESRKEWLLKMFEEHGRANSNNTKYQLWQQDNHPVELDTNKMKDERLAYIHNNPVKAGYVYKPEDYIYSSAMDYCDEKGLLDIVWLD
jgi:REP element-mobilizing transposase RayT